ncbi:uncharacterized protein LACBIDRAFT_297002 [Laccaria bicolor S238N-H82]|uniref:Predicted protein n=1 Tax=Laccaria bicolor (strain S238N-H82 / ATCC MYA-4686) TaxID=486041 RepID=B0D9R9_LACBS|nr:uncharacterized protein LACBIDRAFT_297002 [Laccaria bicolor S238N-H82]EDR08399.1 predicted protein [Laccaria bicolor S238N-H82]|eukprot:XP_001880624.1 predicted protein [Laccaria bicolor S238N-H82]
MAIRKKTSTTRLPQSILQELGESSGNSNSRSSVAGGRSRSHVPRKDARKQEREARKQKKAAYFSVNNKKRLAEEEHHESPQRKKPRQASSAEPRVAAFSSETPSTKGNESLVAHKPAAPVIKTKKLTKSKVIHVAERSSHPAATSRVDDGEDAYISYLESQLGYSKSGKKKKIADDDGLDDLLNWADGFTASMSKAKPDDAEGDAPDVSSESNDSDSTEDGDYPDEEWNGIEDSEGDEEPPAGLVAEIEINPKPATAYVPPHLRKGNDEGSEAMIKLTRQLKGLLNRMSEQNIGAIVESLEGVFRSQRRNDVTSTLTTLIIDGISSHSSHLDSYVVLYTALVSSLHKLIGVEFAAHFVQTAVTSYERHYAALPKSTESTISEQEVDTQGKECSNLIVLISELYNLQVVSCVLVFDIIKSLLNDTLSEFNIELLLKVVRNSGQQLRQDDPSALKDIIQIVQNKVSGTSDGLSSRTRFMIETLTNLKNNKLKRNLTQNQGGAAVDRMKKFLSGLGKNRQVLAHEPLRVTLEDLHCAESKGKWWLVGAAWGGDPLVDRQMNAAGAPGTARKEENQESELLKLARSQGMNSDIRRSIFVVLMSSDDYVDACERLSQLNLTDVQQREIVRVVLHCCGQEKSYNPYYSLVCQQLCRSSHSYKITIQFCLWDFLRELGETSVGGAEVIKNTKEDEGFDLKSISKARLRNVARAYAWWIAKDCVTLAILKPVDFTQVKPQTREFLKELLIQLFIASQKSAPLVVSNFDEVVLTRNRSVVEEIFIKAARIENLATGLVYFMTEAFRDLSMKEDGLSKFLGWAVALARETLQSKMNGILTQ